MAAPVQTQPVQAPYTDKAATVTARNIDTAAITYQKQDVYDQVTGKSREVYAFITFETANVLKAAPHALGRAPVSFYPVSMGRAGGLAPGTLYTGDLPLPFDKYNFALKCSTANTWAIVALR